MGEKNKGRYRSLRQMKCHSFKRDGRTMKRVIAFLWVVAIVFSLCPYITTAAASNERVVVFTAEEKSVAKGDTVEYEISLACNEAIALRGIAFRLNFNKSAFFIESVTVGEDFPSAAVDIQNLYGYVSFVWEAQSAFILSTDTLFTVTLRTFSDAYCQTYYPEISGLEIFDDNAEDIPAWTGDIGGIKVTEPVTLNGFVIETYPSKDTYTKDSQIDTTGLSLMLFYSDGSMPVITSGFTVEYDFSTTGVKRVYVSYGGFNNLIWFTVTVTNSVPPTDITSSVYSVSGGYIGKIAAGTRVESLISKINEKDYVKVYKNGVPAQNTDTVKTGMTVTLMVNGLAVKTVTVVVTGDISGTGDISVVDMLLLKSHLSGESVFSGAMIRAADINGDKTVTTADFLQMQAYLLKKESIEPGI